MRYFIIVVFAAVALLSGFGWLHGKKGELPVPSVPIKTNTPENKKKAMFARLKKIAHEIGTYAVKNNCNSKICFLIDMHIPSGRERFFVYDLQNDTVLKAGLVTNGKSLEPSGEIIFSNKPGSNCSSLGKYKIGTAYTGDFGLAYKLHGLDSSNSNAFKRFVVLHAHACVPDREVAPAGICQSWGCPTVSPSFLAELKKYMDKSEQTVLLEIVY
jgi:hypothetical protein